MSRRITGYLLVTLAVVGACDRSDAKKLTTEQAQQVEAARQASITSTQQLLGRPLTEPEKDCIHVDFDDGRVRGRIAPPLSETLKKRQAELLERYKGGNAGGAPARGGDGAQ